MVPHKPNYGLALLLIIMVIVIMIIIAIAVSSSNNGAKKREDRSRECASCFYTGFGCPCGRC